MSAVYTSIIVCSSPVEEGERKRERGRGREEEGDIIPTNSIPSKMHHLSIVFENSQIP